MYKASIAVEAADTAEQALASQVDRSTQSELGMDTLASWEDHLQVKDEMLQTLQRKVPLIFKQIWST